MTTVPVTEDEKAAYYAETGREPDVEATAAVERWKAGTDLVEPSRQLPEVQRWQQMIEMARYLSRSALMPAHIRESRDPEADAVVVLLAAHDLGLNATTAFQDMHVVKGKLGMSAKLMRALVRRDGHLLDVEVQPGEQGAPFAARAYGRRADDPPDYVREVTFTLEDARVAQLIESIGDDGVPRTSKEKLVWRSYTADMLVARATSRWARYNAEESLGGLSYTPDELGEIVEVENLAQQLPPSEPIASDEERAVIGQRIAALPAEAQQRLRAEWKRANLGPLVPSPKGWALKESQLGVADLLVRYEEDQLPADAEIVDESPGGHAFEGAESAEACATCGQPRSAAIHHAGEELPVEPPATAPAACALCGSTRAWLATVDGVSRCQNVNDCRKRMAAHADDGNAGPESTADPTTVNEAVMAVAKLDDQQVLDELLREIPADEIPDEAVERRRWLIELMGGE